MLKRDQQIPYAPSYCAHEWNGINNGLLNSKVTHCQEGGEGNAALLEGLRPAFQSVDNGDHPFNVQAELFDLIDCPE